MNLVGGEAGYHDHRVVEAQGSTNLRVDPVNAIQKHGVQHHHGEDNVKSVEGAVEYVRKIVDHEYEDCSIYKCLKFDLLLII